LEQNVGEDIFDIPMNQIPIRGETSSSNVMKKACYGDDVEDMDKKSESKEVMDDKHGSGGVERIKSWEYDKWDKFDVEEELTRLDVVDMQTKEWEKVQKPKIEAEQRHGGAGGVEGLMKNLDKQPKIQTTPTSSLFACQTEEDEMFISQPPPPPLMDVSTPSFLEEVSEEKPKIIDKPLAKVPVVPVTQLPQSRPRTYRRFRVDIEDVHIGI